MRASVPAAAWEQPALGAAPPAVFTRCMQQPRDGIRRWRIGPFLHRTQDLAAIGGFPMWAGIVPADPVSARVEEIGFGSHERPFVSPALILSGTAFVDLHTLCGNDHRQR